VVTARGGLLHCPDWLGDKDLERAGRSLVVFGPAELQAD
jgi:hypothetical protein